MLPAECAEIFFWFVHPFVTLCGALVASEINKTFSNKFAGGQEASLGQLRKNRKTTKFGATVQSWMSTPHFSGLDECPQRRDLGLESRLSITSRSHFTDLLHQTVLSVEKSRFHVA